MDIILSTILGITSSILFSFISNLLSKNKINKISMKINENVKLSGKSIIDDIHFDSDIDLRLVCSYIELYFKKISPDNKVFIKVLKCTEKNEAIIVYSNIERNDSIKYNLNENTSMYSVIQRKDAYFNNNIQYFLKHGKPYVEQYKLWNDSYKSIMCFPMEKNENIIGFLLIGLNNPLNELIDFDNIKEHMEQICNLISDNKMFIEAKIQ